MQRALVLSSNRIPLMPCHPARARQLLKVGRAAVYRRYPFTIILKDRECGAVQPVELKVDPGSRTTGLAVAAQFERGWTSRMGCQPGAPRAGGQGGSGQEASHAQRAQNSQDPLPPTAFQQPAASERMATAISHVSRAECAPLGRPSVHGCTTQPDCGRDGPLRHPTHGEPNHQRG